MKRSPYEGLQRNIRNLNTPKIDTWKNQYADRNYVIGIKVPEFTCICPKTGLPDFAVIEIRYIPDKLCIELKSLKYYTIFFRDIGIFNEHVVNKILDDIVKATGPRWAEVTGEFNARGGIKTVVKAEHNRQARPE